MFDIEELVKALRRLSPHIPATHDYWSTKEIAFLLKRSENVVRDHIVNLPSFPSRISLPSRSGGRSHPLWKAGEVIAWVEMHREKRSRSMPKQQAPE
jgi:hypothetical protein